ncbi:MAG TPA: POTRA domain-containing protein [Ignavibacteria bacterium]
MKITAIILLILSLPLFIYSQNDSLVREFEKKALQIDSLNYKVKQIIITGNNVTKDEIILREMILKKGSRFTLKKYSDDLLSIYNLALFTKVDIIPVPAGDKELVVNVDVKERWFIIPLPIGGIEDGELKKIWAGINLRWDNFRGRNERVNFAFRLFYNPSVSFGYQVPWIGKKLHLFGSIGGAWSRTRNQSLVALGKVSGSNTLDYDDDNFENTNYNGELTIGKTFKKNYSFFTDFKYNYLSVTKNAPGRTLSPDGEDQYLTFGGGFIYDSRNIIEYSTRGDYFRADYHRFGFIDKEINFGRFSLENQSFIPIPITGDYFLTVASRLFTNLAAGAIIPYYSHEYLGYSEDYVRGWKGKAFEGEDVFTIYNELRIPILKPRYIKAKDIMVMKDMPIIKNLDLRHGLYATIIYDIGTVWYKNENIFKKRFISGVGIGINIIAPFGYVLRADWVARIDRPVIGQIGLSLSAKF